jgi:hypothetical protein
MSFNFLKRINIVRILLGTSSIALAFAWGKFISVGYVYFPVIPDIFDVMLGFSIGLFLFWEAFVQK